jgi:AhpD family alkylhydroperoxidase
MTRKEQQMTARLNLLDNGVAMKFGKYLVGAHRVLTDSTLPAPIQRLINIRVSQINGCSACTAMHTKEAAYAGESQFRINMVAAWRETDAFTDAERAALELAEQGTRIADSAGVSDEAWANAAKHFDNDQLAALISTIALINAMNRANVIACQPATDLQPEQLKSMVDAVEHGVTASHPSGSAP